MMRNLEFQELTNEEMAATEGGNPFFIGLGMFAIFIGALIFDHLKD